VQFDKRINSTTLQFLLDIKLFFTKSYH